MGRSNSCVSDIAQHPPMYRSHRISVLFGIPNNFHYGGARTYLYQLKAKRFGDCRRIDKTRFRDGASPLAAAISKNSRLDSLLITFPYS
jgi:hypothetical protein